MAIFSGNIQSKPTHPLLEVSCLYSFPELITPITMVMFTFSQEFS